MITIHHLNESRSQRILWLMEELSISYEIVQHFRDPVTRLAPPELRAIHPLGKSPVIVDSSNGATIIESGAIIEYLVETHGGGRLKPANGTPEALLYLQWMHYAEGSAMLPLLLKLYTSFLANAAAPLQPRIDGEIANHLGYMNGHFAAHQFACGSAFSAADIQLTFVFEAARALLEPYPALSDFKARMHSRPAYKAAVERGGPYAMGT
jgi:glutathione S-transferase